MSLKGIAGLFLLGLFVVSSVTFSFPSFATAAETRKCISQEDLTDISHGIWTSGQIRDVQLFLKDLKHYVPDIDESYLTGKIGTQTRRAISSFQGSEGLEVVGSIGPSTARLIHRISCGKQKAKLVLEEKTGSLSLDRQDHAPSVTAPAKKPVVSAAKPQKASTPTPIPRSRVTPAQVSDDMSRRTDAPVTAGPRVAGSPSASTIPIAQFSANDSTNITVSPGDVIRYKWSSTGGSRFVSSYSSDQASCGTASTGKWWADGMAGGERTDTVQDCQAGRLYTITYDVSNSSSETARATVTVRVLSLTETRPTATFTANGSNDITVSVGDSINYAWASTGGRSYVSNVIADQPSCGGPANTGWWANGTASGERTDTVGECQAGRTYNIAYDVITGVQSAHAQVIVRVRPTTEVRPTVGFTANGADDLTVNTGDQITYAWSSTGTGLTSVWSSDQASCGAGSGGPWDANTTQGSRTDTVGECQAGRTYTITAKALNGSQTSAKSVTVRVRPVVKFTANGSEVASVSPAGSVTYALAVIPADAVSRITNAYATYTRAQADACGPAGESGPWTPPSLNGSRTDNVSSCQAGGGYRITYRYILDGRTEEKTVIVSVRSTVSLGDFGRFLGNVFQGVARLLVPGGN